MPGLIKRLKSAIAACRIIDGVGYKVQHTPSGQIVYLARASKQSDSDPVYDAGFKAYFKTSDLADDTIEVGRNRSATRPAVIYVGLVGKVLTASEEVALWGGADGTRCLVLKAVESGGTITQTYEWKEAGDLAALNSSDGTHYHPLAWVTVQTLDGYKRVTKIKWNTVAWLPAVFDLCTYAGYDVTKVQVLGHVTGAVQLIDVEECDS